MALTEISVSLMILRGFAAIFFLVLFLNSRNRRHLVVSLGFLLSAVSVILQSLPYPESSPVWALADVTSLGANALIACGVISYLRPQALRAFYPVLFVMVGTAAFATLSLHGSTAAVWFAMLEAIVLAVPVVVYGRLRHEAKRLSPAAPHVLAAVFLTSSACAILVALADVPSVVAAAGMMVVTVAQVAVFIFAEHSAAINDARRAAKRLKRAEMAVGVGLWERDATTGNAVWSAGHFQLFGLPPDSASAPNWEEFVSMIHPDDRKFIENSQWTETSTGTADLIQYRIVRPDGEVRWVSSKAIAIDSHISYGIAVDITALKSAEERLQESLRQKDSLIAEIQHRVKNNLQVISSMFNLQFVANHNPVDTQSEIERFRARLEAMATLQSLILDSADASNVEMQSYVQQLLGCLDSNARYMAGHPSIRANMHGIHLDMSTAITVGSIISEVSSSLTNQPIAQNQTVNIDLQRRGDHYRLAISSRLDDGSLEMALVRTYASQLRGTVAIDDPDGPLAITFETDPFTPSPATDGSIE